jgi:hypothetical protein
MAGCSRGLRPRILVAHGHIFGIGQSATVRQDDYAEKESGRTGDIGSVLQIGLPFFFTAQANPFIEQRYRRRIATPEIAAR